MSETNSVSVIQVIRPGQVEPVEIVNVYQAMIELAPHTQRAYVRWITVYLKYALQYDGAIPLESLPLFLVRRALKPSLLKKWLDGLRNSGKATKTIRQAKSAVLWLAQVSASVDILEYEQVAALSAVRAPRNVARAAAGTWLTKEQVRLLLSKLQERHANNPAQLRRDTAIILLMVLCGLRRSEVAAARWRDISVAREITTLLVRGKAEKTRNLKLPPSVASAVAEWRPYHPNPAPEQPVFVAIRRDGVTLHYGITDQTIWSIVQEAAREAELPRISPHDLRRTFARGAYEAGASYEQIKQVLGHESIMTTERYIQALMNHDVTASDVIDRAMLDEEELPPDEDGDAGLQDEEVG